MVSKKINIVFFVLLIILVAMPFFGIQTGDDSYEYIGGTALLPGLGFLDAQNTHALAVRGEYENIIYYSLVLIPIIEIILMSFSIYLERKDNKKKLSVLFETLCYFVNFIGFVFAIFSLKESPTLSGYEFSFGYFGTIFAYVLVYAVKIMDYLTIKTPPESELWPAAVKSRKGKRAFKRK